MNPHRTHHHEGSGVSLQYVEGLSLPSSTSWPSTLSLQTFNCILGLQCYLRTVNHLIPSHGGQRREAAHQDDGRLQKQVQTSAPLLTRMGQMLSRVPGVGTLCGHWDSRCCRKGLKTDFGQATRPRCSPMLRAQASPSCEARGAAGPYRSPNLP